MTVAAMIGFGCDTGTLAPVTEPDLPKGPSLDAFPRAALFTEGEIDGLLSQKSGDTLVVVPLVFDESDRLHSPLSFNLRLDSLRSSAEGGAGSPDPDQTFFTDYDTFLSVINGHKNARGESYAALYPSTDRFAAPGGVSVGNKQRDGYTGLYDPFSCLDNPDDCPADPGGTPPTYGHPGGPGGPSQPYRPSSDVSVDRAASPSWPLLWVGDVISGEKDCGQSSGSSASGCESSGGSSAGFSDFGHSLIVTATSGDHPRWGGELHDQRTRSMEAVGDRDDVEDEVVEREAEYWFKDTNLEYAYVRYHRGASWEDRELAVQIAELQDEDPYTVMTKKTNPNYWYCSKLVWYAYNVATGDNLDPSWGFWVSPWDLENSNVLTTVYHYEHE